MRVYLLNEVGYVEAMIGISLSHGTSVEQAKQVAKNLSQKDGGHNKFLESIMLWFDVTAPRHWWQEADTYRISSKQSESTMHTIHRRDLVQEDFEGNIPDCVLELLNMRVQRYRADRTPDNLKYLKDLLPEGFLQRRIWVMSYKTLRNITRQRHDHRQPGWREVFVPYAINTIQHPEFL